MNRLRFAPSPTGQLHIGGARTALFNWAYARHTGGVFVLRIEDTDAERSRKEHEHTILESLRWLGLAWDEGPEVGGPFGPYRQSERLERHQSLAAELVERGAAYRCFCTSERLDALREAQVARKETPAYDRACAAIPPEVARARESAGEPCVVRFRVPAGATSLEDEIRGPVTFDNREVDDWIMLRKDRRPTYNFVVVCDDVDMRITHVVRGEEHLVNTPKQVLLYRAFEEPLPRFAHLPLMLGADGKKLSKRTGDTALADYRAQGFSPEATLNFLSLQGWALDGSTEVFGPDELVARFELGAVSKGGAIFDLTKFRWLAGEYVRRASPAQLAERCAPYVVAAGLASAAELEERRAWFEVVVASEQERFELYSELPGRIAYLFEPDLEVTYEPEAEAAARKQPEAAELLAAFGDWLAARLAEGSEVQGLGAAAKQWVKDRGLKLPALFQPLRCALTGRGGGPDLFTVMGLLGPEAARRRIAAAVQRLRASAPR
jgi:glutamyl-tRNA synthetase